MAPAMRVQHMSDMACCLHPQWEGPAILVDKSTRPPLHEIIQTSALKPIAIEQGQALLYPWESPVFKELYFSGGTNRTSSPLASETLMHIWYLMISHFTTKIKNMDCYKHSDMSLGGLISIELYLMAYWNQEARPIWKQNYAVLDTLYITL